jgi:hypothetical protein
MRIRRIAVSAASVLALAAAGATYAAQSQASAQGPSLPAQVRAATAPYHDLSTAQDAGWNVLFHDVTGQTCIEDLGTPSMGGMGYHYVNPGNIGSTDPAQPAAVIYAGNPRHQRLVGVEYLVPDSPTGSASMPSIDGQDFMYTPPGNRILGDTAFWSLHVWAWDHNPSGMYSMWNPKVSCP